jgi:tripartite ATP-independent transporter DctP family solute receptor
MRVNKLVLATVPAALVLVACGGGDGAGEGGDANASSGEEVKLAFANSYTTEHPHTRCGIQKVADEINGQDLGLDIEVFPNSQLGGDVDRVASVGTGDLEMDVQGSSALGSVYEPIGVMDAAYAFDDADHLFEFFDSDASDQLKQEFEEAAGMHILDVWYFGDRHFTANQPIRTPEDLKGLRMRFPDSPQYLANAKAIGASATAVAFEEVFLALQQGIVDGQENPIPTIAEMSFDEVQSHVSLSGHQIGSQMVVINSEVWDSLSSEQQDALQTVVSETRSENRACIEAAEEEILQEWADSGAMEVVEDVDRDAFQQKAEAYFRDNLSEQQLAVYDAIREAAS